MRPRQLILILATAATLFAQADVTLQRAMRKETLEGDLRGAIALYEKTVAEAKGDRASAAKALIRMAECYQKLGNSESRKIYEQILREYADQREAVATARTRLAASGPAPGSLRANQVWAGLGVDPLASLADDGRTLVASARGGIELRNLSGGESKLIPLKSGFAEFPVLSPDRKLVAHGWANPQRQFEYDLQIVDTETGARTRTLISNPEFNYFVVLGWSQEGESILVNIADHLNSWRLAWVAAADGSIRQLKTFTWESAGGIALSPDRRFIAYHARTARDSQNGEIRILSADGSADDVVVSGSSRIGALVWTADGSKIVFSSDRSGAEGLWRVAIREGKATGAPALLKAQTGKVRLKGFTHDGSLLYVQSHRGQDLFRVRVDGGTGRINGEKTLLTESFAGSNVRPSWSPDGSHLAYISYRGDPDEDEVRFSGTLVVRTLATGKERIVGDLLHNPSTPMWMPNGETILVTARNKRNSTCLYQADLAKGTATQLHDFGTSTAPVAALSRDGKTLYVVTKQVVAYSLESDREIVLQNLTGRIRHLSVSPDGSRLAMFKETATPERTSRLITANRSSSPRSRTEAARHGTRRRQGCGGGLDCDWQADRVHQAKCRGGIVRQPGRHTSPPGPRSPCS